MRVALLGAPGAGKTKVAKAMARELNRDHGPDMVYEDRPWKVIDGYVNKLTQRTGTQYGAEAGYVQNVQIMSERWTLEDEAYHRGLHTITCGSIYDTMTYAALLNLTPPAEERERLLQYQIVSTFLGFFGMVEQTHLYDHLFYVPWQGEMAKEEHSWGAVVNAKLPEILSGFGRTATALTGPTKQQVKDALKVTRFIRDSLHAQETGATVDEQRAV